MCLFALQPSEAWQLTPLEYWSLYDFKVLESEAKNPRVQPMTREEFEELKQWDEARGKARGE